MRRTLRSAAALVCWITIGGCPQFGIDRDQADSSRAIDSTDDWGCQSNDDCPEGCYCDGQGGCAEAGMCERDADCAPGFSCDDRSSCVPGCESACEPAEEDEPMCGGDSQCGGGVCEEGMCHFPCQWDAECGTGDVCLSDTCRTDPDPGPDCVFNADCGAELTCINGYCHCACEGDEDCQDAQDFCDHGLCRPDWRPVSECAANRDCADGFSCVDGACRFACWSDSECASGESCVMGFCEGSS